ncbi:MAG: hypothetical protein GEU98_27875 [Pseudonocardiaceae bacterium]|nr:hypothetical protein [Pseudonocardiaceae bacterium]
MSLTLSGSRAATNELLAVLRDGRWRPRAWARFVLLSTARSARQARLRPRALAEITLLHTGFAALSARRTRMWTLTSWALAVTHLGMLEQHRSIGLATSLTLARADLPTLTGTRWLPALALASDLADGRRHAKLFASRGRDLSLLQRAGDDSPHVVALEQ